MVPTRWIGSTFRKRRLRQPDLDEWLRRRARRRSDQCTCSGWLTNIGEARRPALWKLGSQLHLESKLGQRTGRYLAPQVAVVAFDHRDAGPRDLRHSQQVQPVVHQIADHAVP